MWCSGSASRRPAPWPDAGFVDADRLELLVGILEALERRYEAWASGGEP